MKSFVFIFLLLVGSWSQAQTPRKHKKVHEHPALVKQPDSLAPSPTLPDMILQKKDFRLLPQEDNDTTEDAIARDIHLGRVIVVAPFRFKSRKEHRHYLILERKTKKVWPYAVMASQRLTRLRIRLNSLHSNRAKRQYTKIVQRYIEGKFKERLKKLTHQEGQILVKLMYRQTGETTYDIIRELRSGFKAFFYNITAHLFTISLKEKYAPYMVKDDYFIEHILRMAFQRNQLKFQPPAIPINYAKINKKWRKP